MIACMRVHMPLGMLLVMVFSGSGRSQPAGSDNLPAVTIEHRGSKTRLAPRTMHPPVRLVDRQEDSVLESGKPVSLQKSCGACHDTEYIARHNYHALAGLDEMHAPGETGDLRPWDTSPGLFGRWDPLTYRWLTPLGSAKLDMGTAEWIELFGSRHVGGGPAEFSRRNGRPLDTLESGDKLDPETHVIDSRNGEPRSWDWKRSGTVELNCLLCHMKSPNNAARVAELSRGNFRWASTATLAGSGIVSGKDGVYSWNKDSFGEGGAVKSEVIGISEPRSDNCRLCHGRACRCIDPVVFENSLHNWSAETSGTVFSGGKMFDSGMNLKGKAHLSSPWDVHAQRLLKCSECHYSMNNPTYNTKEDALTRPRHLAFDARRLGISEYLRRPDHDLAKGHTSQGTCARRLDSSMRNCRDCHNAEKVHDFLPYKKTHFEKLGCQPCHVARVYAPAREVTDWTLLGPMRAPRVTHRGVAGPINLPTTLITGYEPVLLMHKEEGGHLRIMPHNIVSSWFWVEGKPGHPLRLYDLERALFGEDGNYRKEIIKALDSDGDGKLSDDELRLDGPEKVAAVTLSLKEGGAVEPHIAAEIQPYTISHGVTSVDLAVKCCSCCHSRNSRVTKPIELAGYVPGGVIPTIVPDAQIPAQGEIEKDAGGRLVYRPTLDPATIYIHGSSHLGWMDIVGLLLLFGTLLGVSLHGLLRVVSERRRRRGLARS